MYIDELTTIGLSDGEARVYSALLKYGDLSATEIANKTGLGRTNIYEYAGLLEKRGLLRSYEHKKKMYYHANDPDNLHDIVQDQISTIKKKELILSEILPPLIKNYQENSGVPQTKVLIGDIGFKTFSDAVYLRGNSRELYVYVNDLDKYEPPQPKYISKINERRLKTYILMYKGESYEEFIRRDERMNRKTCKVDLNIDMDIVVYEDKVFAGNIFTRNFKVIEIKNYIFASFLTELLKNYCGN